MANRSNTFLWKRSNIAGKIPTNGDLLLGEMALNTADVKLYASGTTANSILPIGWDRVSRTGDTMTGQLNGTIFSATTYYGDGSNLTGIYNEYNKYFIGSMSSGIISGGSISINPNDATKFDLSAGNGVIVDNWTDVDNPVVYEVQWPDMTGNTAIYLSSSTQSHISIDKDGVIQQFPQEETNEERRDLIMLAQLGHTDNITIKNVNTQVTVFASPIEQHRDLLNYLGLINFGNIISPNGANLSINKSYGVIFGQGINFTINPKDPNAKVFSADTAITFQYRVQTGGTFSNTTLINPLLYDNGGVLTAVPGNQATNQRIYMLPNGNIRIQYGQQLYANLPAAIQASQTEAFTVYNNLAQTGILIGIICVQKNCIDLTDTSRARFLLVSKFGENIGGAAGISTTSLQQAYNNSVTPEITTNSTLGAVSIVNGAGADTLNILEGLNSGGTITSYIKGNGNSYFNSISATTIYGDGSNITGITGSFGITIDGSGSVISSGVKGYVVLPYNAIITGWDIIGNTSGDCMVDLWKTTGPTIPTIANTITGTEQPRLISQQINSDNTLTTWSTSLFTNDIVAFNVVSATTVSRINLIIKVIKN